ncbi:hypothetical protein [Actinomyces succiniciruminis]|nr:hypothetical protein [Actinomyces succiniciruminis]
MGWDLTKGRGTPGFVGSKEDARYFRNDAAPDFEPLVIFQEFHGVVPDTILISEEFRLLMGLWQDPKSGNYFQIKDDGTKELAVKFEAQKIEVRTPILNRYLAARQLDAVLFLDSTVSVRNAAPTATFDHLEIEDSSNGKDACIARNIGRLHLDEQVIFSRVLAKRILQAPPQAACGIWPWDDIDPEDYPEFIIGESETGVPIKFTCNPDRLANYFGANPDAPHYLTPVFFKPDVMQKYYDNPSLYSVGDGGLSCAQLWHVQIDNDDPTFVAVFLGDLGRDVPQGEWSHWLSYNVPPTQKMSETNFRRSILGQFTTSKNPEHHFKTSYEELNRIWERRWGWPLYREATHNDKDVIRRLRIPVNDTSTEFQAQLLNLALILVDLLNERALSQEVSVDSGTKGIGKLQRFLEKHSYRYVDRDTSLLRTVQRMRSHVAAHASGSKGQKVLDNELSGRSPREYFQQLTSDAVQMMRDLIEFATQSDSRPA